MDKLVYVNPQNIVKPEELRYHWSELPANLPFPFHAPVLLHEEQDKLVAVDGFARIEAAVKKGIEKIPAIIDDSDRLFTVFLRGAEINNSTDNLSVSEQLRLLNILQNRFPEKVADMQLLSWLTVPVSPKFRNSYAKFYRLPEKIQLLIHNLQPSFKQFTVLMSYPSTLLHSLLELYAKMPFNIKNGLYFIDAFFVLKKKSDIDIDKKLPELLRNLNRTLNGSLTVNGLKDELNALLYPETYSKRENLKKLARSLTASGMAVNYDINMEKNGVEISFSLTDKDDLTAIRNIVSDEQIREKLYNMLKIIEEG